MHAGVLEVQPGGAALEAAMRSWYHEGERVEQKTPQAQLRGTPALLLYALLAHSYMPLLPSLACALPARGELG